MDIQPINIFVTEPIVVIIRQTVILISVQGQNIL